MSVFFELGQERETWQGSKYYIYLELNKVFISNDILNIRLTSNYVEFHQSLVNLCVCGVLQNQVITIWVTNFCSLLQNASWSCVPYLPDVERRGALYIRVQIQNCPLKWNEIFRNFEKRRSSFGKSNPGNFVAFNFPPEIFGNWTIFRFFWIFPRKSSWHLNLFWTVLNFWLNAKRRILIFLPMLLLLPLLLLDF